MPFKDTHIICTKELPCPICGRDHYCAVKKNGRWARCTVESNGAAYVTTDGQYIHRLRRDVPGLAEARTNRKPPKIGSSTTKIADPQGLNLIYQALQGQLRLESYHRNLLQARGLTDEAIIRAGYRTLPAPSKGRAPIARFLRERFGEEIFRVPGFYIAEGENGAYATIAGYSGMLVPVRNQEGQIVAMKIRRDGVSSDPAKKEAKYVWLSSNDKNHGVSPGAPLHFPLGTLTTIRAIQDRLAKADDADASAAFAVRITEGELKADASFRLSGEPVICIPGVNNWRPLIPILKSLGITRIKIAYDMDMLEKKSVAKNFAELVKGTRKAGLTVDVEKWDPAQKGIDDLLYSGGKPELLSGPDVDLYVETILDLAGVEEKGDPESKSAASDLVKYVIDETELWHTEDRQMFATNKVAPRWTYGLKSTDFKDWLAHIWYSRRGGSVNSETLGSAVNTLRAHARFEGKKYSAATRVAEREGAIVVDLGDEEWKAVVITSSGWEVQANHQVRFRRPEGSTALPVPAREGNLNDLREFVNVSDERDWILFVGFLLAAFRPTGPYPVLCLYGEKGAGKSTLTKIIRRLIDPTSMPLASMPSTERDLAIAAGNTWILSLDNLSYLPPWFSDALCRLSTGGGFRIRALFQDDEEKLFQAERPTIINGIEELATRGDLLDRCLMLTLPAMSRSQRKDNRSIWKRFEEIRPKILGTLFDAVACGLRRINDVRLPELPRMADLVCWVTACEPALDWEPGTFVKCFNENAAEANRIAVEASPVARAVIKLVEEDPDHCWKGTASELLKALENVAGDRTIGRKGWPKEPHVLSGRISQISQNLLDEGVLVERVRGEGRERARLIRLTLRVQKEASEAPAHISRDASLYEQTGSVRGRFEKTDRPENIEAPARQVVTDQGVKDDEMRAGASDAAFQTGDGTDEEVEF